MHGPAGGLTGGLEGLEGKQEAWCGVRRRPLEKRCWKWSELGKVEAFGVSIKLFGGKCAFLRGWTKAQPLSTLLIMEG